MGQPNWHKVEHGKSELKSILESVGRGKAHIPLFGTSVNDVSGIEKELPWDEIFDRVMGRTEAVPLGGPLPGTGIGGWMERRLSAMRVLPFWNFDRNVQLCLSSVSPSERAFLCLEGRSMWYGLTDTGRRVERSFGGDQRTYLGRR